MFHKSLFFSVYIGMSSDDDSLNISCNQTSFSQVMTVEKVVFFPPVEKLHRTSAIHVEKLC